MNRSGECFSLIRQHPHSDAFDFAAPLTFDNLNLQGLTVPSVCSCYGIPARGLWDRLFFRTFRILLENILGNNSCFNLESPTAGPAR